MAKTSGIQPSWDVINQYSMNENEFSMSVAAEYIQMGKFWPIFHPYYWFCLSLFRSLCYIFSRFRCWGLFPKIPFSVTFQGFFSMWFRYCMPVFCFDIIYIQLRLMQFYRMAPCLFLNAVFFTCCAKVCKYPLLMEKFSAHCNTLLAEFICFHSRFRTCS